MKYLKYLTIISVLSFLTIGYFYQDTKSELDKTTLDCQTEKDSLLIEYQIELDKANRIIDSLGDTSNIEVDSLERLLNIKITELESFKIENGFKYQKLVTQVTELNDELAELKIERDDLVSNLDKRDKVIINKKREIKDLEIKIDSLRFEIKSLEVNQESEFTIIQQELSDTLEIKPVDEMEDKDNNTKKKKKKRKS